MCGIFSEGMQMKSYEKFSFCNFTSIKSTRILKAKKNNKKERKNKSCYSHTQSERKREKSMKFQKGVTVLLFPRVRA